MVDSSGSSSGGKPPTGRRKGATVAIGIIAVIVVVVIIIAGMGLLSGIGNKKTTTPSNILIGMPYSGSGAFAFPSGFIKTGFQLWVNQTNANGGLYLSSYGKSVPIKMIYLNDQSSTSTVATDYTNLITQDHVNILMAGFGSTLTAPGVSIAKNNKMVLWDTTGTTPTFFTANNPYMVLLGGQVSSLWPDALAGYIVAHHNSISKVAILYTTQDFTTAQANTVDTYLTSHGITPVYYKGTSDSSTSEYLTTLAAINATNPDAVLEFGYGTNDISFLTAMSTGNYHFNMTFTINAALETSVVANGVPAGALNYTYTYASPPYVQYSNVTIGPSTAQFVSDWKANNSGQPPVFNAMAGYASGELLGKIITTAGSLNQTALRAAANKTSGSTTMDGPFILNKTTGAQLGEAQDLLQFQGNTSHPVVVYPTNKSTGNATYPAPDALASVPAQSSSAPDNALSSYMLAEVYIGKLG